MGTRVRLYSFRSNADVNRRAKNGAQ